MRKVTLYNGGLIAALFPSELLWGCIPKQVVARRKAARPESGDTVANGND